MDAFVIKGGKRLRGTVRVMRKGEELWSAAIQSGEQNMAHSLSNLEYHHFKYRLFRQPGDLHVHMFGTATLSFADGIRVEEGDVFEIDAPQLGLPLRNPLQRGERPATEVVGL